jgi:hypothetical protein
MRENTASQNEWSLMSSENVLKKLLQTRPEEKILEKFLKPEPVVKKKQIRAPGRPKVADEKKARNFTLCLAPQFVDFLDRMTVKDPKVKGRGRKIRFIIERFIEHEKRSIQQLKVLKEALTEVQKVLRDFSSKLTKGEKLNLTPKEKAILTTAVDQVHLLLRILGYTPKVLQRILPREDWALVAFCLDWKNNRELKL